MRTIVQYEQLSGSYGHSDHVEMLGGRLDAVSGGAAQASSRRKRYRVLKLRCINDEDSRYAPGERPRSPTRPIPRCGKLGNLPGPYPQQHRELGDNAELRLQRCGGSLHLHFRRHSFDRVPR